MSDYGSDDELFEGITTPPPPSSATLPDLDLKRKRLDDGEEYGDFGDDVEEIVQLSQVASSAKKPKLEPSTQVKIEYSQKVKLESKPQVNPQAVTTLARGILAENFGYTTFRHEQEGAINAILNGDNALAIFPTGAGKSLCYQIPAIAFERLDLLDGSRRPGEHGITIVVSPLIALMKDQVDALQKRGIAADCMDSTKTWPEQQAISAAMREGKLRLLYCAPERLNNEGFVETMKYVKGGVRLVAVDEAHCVSEWGHSFRPEYLKVARFVTEIKAERVICLTATATPKVADDICAAFKIPKSAVFRTSPYRPNLELQAMAVKSKQEKYEPIFYFLRTHPGPTLVYVTLQQQATSMASDLRNQGFKAAAFHAGMKVEEKRKVQDDFMANRIAIVCATIAFGMGIDKPDIRNVVHFDLPSTIEEYSQQIGRAGRDGKPSSCMYYMSADDFYLRENFARGDLPSRESLRSLLQDIFSPTVVKLREGEVFKTSPYTQSRDFDVRQGPLNVIYATLELRFGLIRAITPEYSKYEFIASPSYYSLKHADKSREGQEIYSSATKGKSKNAKWYSVDPTDISNRTGLRRADIVRRLQQLHDTGAIEQRAGGVEPRFRVLKPLPQTDKDIWELTRSLYADLEKKEQDALDRMKQVAALITGQKCFAAALASYFGMDLPGGKKKCGHCTFCLTGKQIILPPRPTERVDMGKIKAVLKACSARDDPRFLARVAFGIKSPRVTKLKLDKDPVFMSLADHSFEALMREFTKACSIPATAKR
ncbi:ATP-dependent DNA helicase recQ [Coniochaeta sp. 2T2.1]|nr:ATP-dependent DNA helicase recQ [Coniochaeta sp. 2T2.1]